MAQKHLLNSVDECVAECLLGFSKLHPNFSVDFERKVVVDSKRLDGKKVAIISGGGSGHEPFPAGYVGEGMLTASVSGDIFTSPPSNDVLHAIRAVAQKSCGVLLLVPNYTGDVLNFGLAAETALGEGILVETLVVGEDVARGVGGSSDKAGRRGMCGLVLAFKVAGYLAENGHDLAAVKSLTDAAVHSMASMGLCVSACSKPGVGLLFRLKEDEMEMGVGVHGESGVARIEMLSARDAVKWLLGVILEALGIVRGDEVVALLNNLGSLSWIEQWLLAGELERQLTEEGIKVARLYAGHFFTSLNMAGLQICLLKLSTETKKTFMAALDLPTAATAWPKSTGDPTHAPKNVFVPPFESKISSKSFRLSSKDADAVKRCFRKIAQDLMAEQNYLNTLDSICGDGDCGTTFARLATFVNVRVEEMDFSDPQCFFSDLSMLMEKFVGGTTGAIYGLFFKGISKELGKFHAPNYDLILSKCWRAGIEKIKQYSPARLGDRTMLDALETGCQAFERLVEVPAMRLRKAFETAIDAAEEGCRKTKYMKASAGRASYTHQTHHDDVDAGAYAVVVWLSAIRRALNELQTK